MLKHKLVDFIIQFMEEVDKEISEMKLFVCSLDEPELDVKANESTAERTSTFRSGVLLDTCKSVYHLHRVEY